MIDYMYKGVHMSRQRLVYQTRPITLRMPVSIRRELDKVTEQTGQTITDAVIEALRYWLNAQKSMLGDHTAEGGDQ